MYYKNKTTRAVLRTKEGRPETRARFCCAVRYTTTYADIAYR